MMPELGCDNRGQAHLDCETGQGTGPKLPKTFAPAGHFLDVEVSRAPKRLFAEQLTNERRFRVHVKTVERGAKDDLMAPRYHFWNPALGQKTKQILVAKPAQFPTWMQLRSEIKNVLIQKRVANFK